jgi:putative selenium metabolism protein SsnA
MDSLLLTGLRLVRPGGDPALIEQGWLVVENGRIAALGSPDTAPPAADSHQAWTGYTVLPGLINAHTHLYSTLALGMPAPARTPRDFSDILESVWWKLDRALDEASVTASFEAGLLDCLRHGVTTVIDHHSSPGWITGSLGRLFKVADEIGPRVAAAFELSDRNGAGVSAASLAENLDTARAGHSRHACLLGLHASFTLEDSTLAAAAKQRRKAGNPGIHIHLAEDLADQADAYRRRAGSVVQRLDRFGLLDERSLVIHGLHLSRGELALLQQRGCMLVHNPTSNANNRVGALRTATAAALPTGLGTDGMQADMLAEAREGSLIAAALRTPGTASIDYLGLLFDNNPRIATRVFGRPLGRLEAGHPADLVFHAYRERTPLSAHNLGGHLLYGLGRPEAVMVEGRFRLLEGRPVGPDGNAIAARAREQAALLWHRMSTLE